MSSFVTRGFSKDGYAGRSVLVAAVLVLSVLTLGAFNPACVVALAHAAHEPVAAAAVVHFPHGELQCCDELRGPSSALETRATPPQKPAEWSPLAVPAAAPALYSVGAPASAVVFAGLPGGSATVPVYLRTLRLRV